MISDAQHADNVEIADIAVDVSRLQRVRGRGNIRFEATARVDVAGILIEIFGLTLRTEPNNRLGCYLPSYRCGDGVWRPAVGLPPVVERAVAQAALEQAGGIIIAEPVRERDAREVEDA